MVAALHLARAGFAVDLLEADDQVGGKLRSAQVAGIEVDVGPDAFVARRPEAVDLCRDLGIAHEMVGPGVSGAAVWARGRLRALPDGLVLGVPTKLAPLARSGIVGPAGILRAAADRCRRQPREPGRAGALSPGVGALSPEVADTQGGAVAPASNDRSVGELVEPRLGHRVTRRLVDPLVGGIHAGPVAALSAEAVFPALLAASRSQGSLMRGLAAAAGAPPPRTGNGPGSGSGSGSGPAFLTLRSGLAGLVGPLLRALEEAGVTVRTGTAVHRLVSVVDGGSPRWQVHCAAASFTVDGAVLAAPAPAAARILGTSDREVSGPLDAGYHDVSAGDPGGEPRGTSGAVQRRLARALGALDYATVTVVTLAFDPDGPARRWRRPPGTGFLVPAEQGLLTTGGTWLSAKWPDVYPEGPVLVRLSAGRYGDERAAGLDEATLVRRLLGELRAVAGDVDDPIDAVVTRWADAFPQYRVGHRSWVGTVTALADALPPLALAGAAYDGVGVPACIGSGHRAARLLVDRLLGSPRPGSLSDGSPRVGSLQTERSIEGEGLLGNEQFGEVSSRAQPKEQRP